MEEVERQREKKKKVESALNKERMNLLGSINKTKQRIQILKIHTYNVREEIKNELKEKEEQLKNLEEELKKIELELKKVELELAELTNIHSIG